MGCFYVKCAFSGLSIYPEDAVRAIIVATSPSKLSNRGYCYADDFWTPVGVPMAGLYNDYGSVDELFPDEALAKNEKLFLGNVIDAKDNENIKDMYDVLNVASRGNGQIKIFGRDSDLGLCLIHERVWNHVLQWSKTFKKCGDGTWYDSMSKAVDEVTKKEDTLMEKIKEHAGLDFCEKTYRHLAKRQLENSMRNALFLGPTMDCGASKEELINFALINEFFSVVGKKWDVPCNQGSQDLSWEKCQEYYQYVADMAGVFQENYERVMNDDIF